MGRPIILGKEGFSYYGNEKGVKLTRAEWGTAIANLKIELGKLKGTGKEPDAKFLKNAFAFDYHYAYPPGTVRQYYYYRRGFVVGKRSNHWSEGPMAYDYYPIPKDQLTEIFKVWAKPIVMGNEGLNESFAIKYRQ